MILNHIKKGGTEWLNLKSQLQNYERDTTR